ncbi:cation-transporting ATPase 13A2-like isoform X2 [Acanthaster planci]|uniref:Cation-transporting ATPase n=1 Tax=Acanthaster planci TaxID=133434 RepID=A0A8B7XX42_ACAPL|nr:cation-transporting ATPase 13A2-like isoform X2 [Acanthaster planci]
MSQTASRSHTAGVSDDPPTNTGNSASQTTVRGASSTMQVGLGNDEVECYGYRSSIPKWVLVAFLTVLTLGMVHLVFYWKPEWGLWCTHSPCPLRDAEMVLLKDEYGQYFVEKIRIRPIEEGLIKQIYPERKELDPKHRENDRVMRYSINTGFRDGSVNDIRVKEAETEDQEEEEEDDNEIDITRALIVPSKREDTHLKLRYFEFQKLTFFWNRDYQFFQLLHGLDVGWTNAAFYRDFPGLTVNQQSRRCSLFGQNLIDVQVKSYPVLFVQEILNPFYVFEIFSIALWFAEQYNSYAICIVIILIISLGVSLYETKRQSVTLRDMVAHHSTVTVCRLDGTCEVMDSKWLVPGDVILIPQHGCVMSCDAVLISGNCIVNESMLTGESVPVTKTPLPNPPFSEADGVLYYSPETHKRHTLFCGTKIIQTRFYGSGKVKAVVARTGFQTLKGDLIRTILFPKPVGFKFYRDALKFVGILSIIGLLGMIYSIVILIYRQADTMDSVWKVLDIITICVPPALPAAMTVGTVYAQNRLKKNGIFCISPQRINICGKLKLICFDKTGTLTEDGLDLWGVLPLQDQHFLPVVQNAVDLAPGPFLVAMATCHSLTMIDGELVGDPLDLKMFEGTNWNLEEPGSDTTRFDTIIPTIVKPRTSDTYLAENPDKVPYEVGILRQFPFSSGLQRMSVITRTLGAKNMEVFVKGSPEMIASLSVKETVPIDFLEVLQRFTQQGYRVIALAWRPLDPKLSWHHSQRIARKEVECNLNFLGLLVLQNALKPETTPIIHELMKADIRTVMVTGDNMLTAISVARDCGMVDPRAKVIMVNASPPSGEVSASIEWSYDTTPEKTVDESGKTSTTDVPLYNGNSAKVYEGHFHFAVTGKSFAVLREHFPDLMPKIVQRGTVFARMSPEQKTQLVEALQDISYCVGMCGDGANDCGALKTAHAGISLSEAEASVASPFTSKTPNISAVPVVIREGRAALVTSLGVFKYMALYSIIQFASVIILYWTNSNLGDWQFLYVDLIITTSVATLMGLNGPHPTLVRKRPLGSLVSPPFLISILIEVLLVCAIQTVAYFSLRFTSWWSPTVISPVAEDNILSYENTVVFTVSSFQYMILAGAFSKGAPYRTPIYKNVLFTLDLIILVLLSTLMLFLPVAPGGVLHWFLIEVMQLKLMSKEHLPYVFFLFGLVLLNFVVSFLLETFVVDSQLLHGCISRVRCKRRPKNVFKLVEREIQDDPGWPPVGETMTGTPLSAEKFDQVQFHVS